MGYLWAFVLIVLLEDNAVARDTSQLETKECHVANRAHIARDSLDANAVFAVLDGQVLDGAVVSTTDGIQY